MTQVGGGYPFEDSGTGTSYQRDPQRAGYADSGIRAGPLSLHRRAGELHGCHCSV